ncbi:MAG: MerR family transcriptional regulator [Lachnospiraceae bacterium]|nr:MerR family transcriptional regulator [Lachnospiraceae bacterium]
MAYTYSTKEFCEIFNVGRETLRHYEKVGLLNPHINEENGYRQYTYWDVGQMIDILKYRAKGLSLEQIRDSLYEADYSQIVDSLKMQRDYYQKQIQHYQLLTQKTNLELSYIEHAEESIGKIFEMDILDLVFLKYKDDFKEKTLETNWMVFNNPQFFASTWLYDTGEQGRLEISAVGFLTEKEYADYLDAQDGIEISASRVVATVYDIQGLQMFEGSMFEDFYEKVDKMYPNASKRLYTSLLTRFYDNDKTYHQYIFAFRMI